MNPSPKATAFRLVLWCVLLAWAAWKIKTSKEGATIPDATDAPPAVAERVLQRPDAEPGAPAATAGPTSALIDPEALQEGLEHAADEGRACGVRGGVLTVTVGPGGLARATLRGDIADGPASCLARAVWAGAWPAGVGEMEAEVEISAIP